MFETAFKNLDNALRKDDGCSTELDYIEQTSWVLFLKYLDDYEKDRETSAKLNGKTYTPIISEEHRWTTWAAPKTSEGKLNFKTALTGDDLLDFVNNQLFPYLGSFKSNADSPDTLKYKIGEIFGEIKNKLQSGYSLRQVINKIDEMRFRSNDEKHEMSSLYEDKIQNMGNAGRNGGEYYTPRSLIKTIIQIVNPQLGETIYDGAVGSAGFLCEAYDFMKNSRELTTQEFERLQKNTLFGKEKKSLAYIVGVMNMILHGVEAPNIIHGNTLSQNITDIQEKDRMDVVLANPPFGSSTEHPEILENFSIRTSETAYLFMQHFIKILKKGGRAGIVIKTTFLSNGDAKTLRKEFLEECNLHTILVLPAKVFTAGVHTVVLFFDKGSPTKNIWFYELKTEKNLGKNNPLTENHLEEFRELQKTKVDSDNSWTVSIDDIDKETWDISPTNPNIEDTSEKRTPSEILAAIETLDNDAAEALAAIKELL